MKCKLISPTCDKNHILYNKKIVFSGFRTALIEKQLVEYNAILSNSITKNTFLLIVKDVGENLSRKTSRAKELGVKIIDLETFKSHYL